MAKKLTKAQKAVFSPNPYPDKNKKISYKDPTAENIVKIENTLKKKKIPVVKKVSAKKRKSIQNKEITLGKITKKLFLDEKKIINLLEKGKINWNSFLFMAAKYISNRCTNKILQTYLMKITIDIIEALKSGKKLGE